MFFFCEHWPEVSRSNSIRKRQSYELSVVKNEKSLFWAPVTSREICNYFHTLDRRKAHGFDNLPIRLLKDSAHLISEPLSYIFNLSLENGVFPDVLKTAKVTPIYKKRF